MARFRLRYQSTDLEMPAGDFVVGRSSSCHLALDDALVSRRHAVFHVDEAGVEVEDLGSRNGVQVNGETIEGRQRIKHLDRVVIGAQELLLVRVHGSDARERGARPTLAGMTLDLPVMKADMVDEPTIGGTGSVIDRIAEKALALGRYDEAERMLSRRLKGIVKEARNGRKLARDKLDGATEYALKLAEGTEKHEWIDWIFEAHDVHQELIDSEAIDRLHQLVRKVRYRGSGVFKAYMQNLRGRAGQLSKGDQFTLRRLEAVERVVGA